MHNQGHKQVAPSLTAGEVSLISLHLSCKYLLGGQVTLGERAFGQILTFSDHPPLWKLRVYEVVFAAQLQTRSILVFISGHFEYVGHSGGHSLFLNPQNGNFLILLPQLPS